MQSSYSHDERLCIDIYDTETTIVIPARHLQWEYPMDIQWRISSLKTLRSHGYMIRNIQLALSYNIQGIGRNIQLALSYKIRGIINRHAEQEYPVAPVFINRHA